MKTEFDNTENEALNKTDVSGSLLNELLAEFQKYQEQIADTKTITDNQYRLMAHN